MRLQEHVLRHVLGYVGPENYIFIASVCRQWKRQYRLLHGLENKITQVGAYVVSSLSILLLHEQDIRDQDMSSFLDSKIGKHGDLSMVQWLSARKRWTFSDSLAESATLGGQLDMLKWIRSNGIQSGLMTCAKAAAGGQLEVLIWLRAAIGCPWDAATCTHAAFRGHLEVLKWARANGCPWNAVTCGFAARGGHLELLKWARAHGCPWNGLVCSGAAEGGHLEVLKWARTNGCPWEEGSTCSRACRQGHLDVLKWAISEGCHWSRTECMTAARDQGHDAIVQWVLAFCEEEARQAS